MAVRPSGEKRRQRGIMATDAEWAAIRAQAEAAGLSISDLPDARPRRRTGIAGGGSAAVGGGPAHPGGAGSRTAGGDAR